MKKQFVNVLKMDDNTQFTKGHAKTHLIIPWYTLIESIEDYLKYKTCNNEPIFYDNAVGGGVDSNVIFPSDRKSVV